ncbi:MAG: hypothetical protein LBC09_01830 [Helicobacteraceae bacterium]|jgi:hypothetical protein|nr:hypothetical protein [Helicobacteraceae bacterium]
MSPSLICGGGSWYLANASAPSASWNLEGDIRFYGAAGVKEISSAAGLRSIGESGRYILINDIAVGSWTPMHGYDPEYGREPCKGAISGFAGILSGDGHTISGFQINLPNRDYIGLFSGVCENGVVKNLNLQIGAINGGWQVGVIAGLVSGGKIEGCKVAGGEVNGDDVVGGIAGEMKNGGAIIDSRFDGRVFGYKGSAGGVVGNTEDGSIINARTSGSVEGGCADRCGMTISSYVGGIAGYIEGTIVNGGSTSSVKAYNYAGGIAGNMFGHITNAYSEGDIYAGNYAAGGIAGYMAGSITNAYALGDISLGGSRQNAGGIAGFMDGAIRNAYSAGNISGSKYVGGIAGEVSNGGSVEYSYALGSVGGDERVGGIVGESRNYRVRSNAAINPEVKGGSKYINRVGGYLPSPDAINNLAWEGTEIAEKDMNYIGDLVSLQTLRDKASFQAIGWSFGGEDARPWVMESGDLYPRFYWQTNGVTGGPSGGGAARELTDSCEALSAGEYCVRFFDANLNLVERRRLSGGAINPSNLFEGSWFLAGASAPSAALTLGANIDFYAVAGVKEVRTQADLEAINLNYAARSGRYMLVSDITLSLSGEGWTPIGAYNARFTGVFNGDGHRISGLWIDKTDPTSARYDYIGLFGAVGENGAVKNLIVATDDSKGVRGHEYVGAVAGALFYGLIDNCRSEGKIAASYQNAGGITGYMDNRAVIKDSGSSATIFVEHNNAGGVVGTMVSGTIESSYSTGEVQGGEISNHIGGVVGYLTDGMIVKSYSTATITGKNFLGGIAGYAQEIGALISASYFDGTVKAEGRNAGGIAGFMDRSGIMNCYSAGEISAIDTVGGIVGSIFSKHGFAAYNYSTAKVEGTGADIVGLGALGSDVGGIVGSAYYAKVINNAAINDAVIGNKNTNRVNGLTMYDGGTANNFALEDMDATIANGENGSRGIDKSKGELENPATYSKSVEEGGLSWRFGSSVVAPWVMPDGGGYPILYWQTK